MQSEFNALQGAIHNFRNFKQKFEQNKRRIFGINKYVMKMAYFK